MRKKLTALFPLVALITILCVGAYLRIYNIDQYMTFLGDEGRDVLIVKRMIVDGKWTLLGPTASVGGFFMGPIYYYFMLPFLWLFQLNPVGPAVMVALFGVATILLVYYAGKTMFDERVGLTASSLYAFSPLVIAYSRSSWNPNIVPFFSLLLIVLLWRAVCHERWNELFFIGVILGIGLQLHYVFLVLFGVVFVWFLIHGREKSHIKQYVMGIAGFLLGFSPFLAFEIRHGFSNTKSIIDFVCTGKDTGFSVGTFFANISDLLFRLSGRLLLRIPETGMLGNLPYWEKTSWIAASWALGGIMMFIFLLLLLRPSVVSVLFPSADTQKQSAMKKGFLLFFVWLVMTLLFFGFYKKNIYDYYLGIIYPLPFFFLGLSIVFCSRGLLGKVLAYGVFIGLLVFNWQGRPFLYPPNNQLGQVRNIAEAVVEQTEGEPFNFALISGGNSDHAYRYFFELWGKTPVTIENEQVDPERNSVTDQLLIVCEDISCQPLGNSLWEVAGFGRAEIEGVWDVSVVKIYKLGHYQE